MPAVEKAGAARGRSTGSGAAGLHYRVEVADFHAHLLRVSLRIDRPAAQQQLSLPVWIPGSYLVREFAKNLQGLQARQAGRPVAITQLDKHRWRVDNHAGDSREGTALELTWQIYAFDNSVRAAWMDATRCFFNATSVCLRVEDQHDAPHALELVAPRPAPNLAGKAGRWQVATGLAPLKTDSHGFGRYLAQDYDELADCPVEMGHFWSGEFKAGGVPHRFVVAGATPAFDGERLLADTRRICEAQIQLWHGKRRPPHQRYVFMLNAVDDGYGGLEHRNSTALICTRRDLPRLAAPGAGAARPSDGYTQLLGLISHEYFHTWNVKRLKPTEFARYDYDAENYTELLWFFEGFTSYYDDIALRRAGVIDDATYLKLLNKTANQVLQTPGREVQSVAQASFDAWVKYYRQDENTANATVSYYTKGALVALCFDLTLRLEGKATLDDVMRALWLRCQAGPMAEADFAAVLQDVGGRSYAKELKAWVHGTGELPLRELLTQHGVSVLDDPAQMAQRLGLRVAETGGSVQVKTVLRGGAAEQAGLAAGDEWLALEVPAAKAGAPGGAWRIHKLDDLPLYAGAHRRVVAVVARDKRLLRLDLQLPAAATTWRLVVRDAAALGRWLAG